MIEKAIIKSTELGLDDRFNSIMTFWLFLDYIDDNGNYTSNSQGFGGLQIDHPKVGIEYLKNILETVGVSEWKNLKGKTIRVKRDGNTIKAIGNRKKDKWLYYPK